MTLQNVKIGDVVQCDVRGRQFYALVIDKLPRALQVRPITHNITYTEVKSTQVIAHWRKAKNGRA